jgi:macrocin-O-methyltransferase TylF-like protien/cephalosporin hydroxylase/methyltransferase family protein
VFPFWNLAIAPVLAAAHARRVVEIGALGGDTTELLLGSAAPDLELHVIDPLPQFDPRELEERYGRRFVLHRDLSLNVLPRLGPMDVALVDGDHNWYTVIHELRQLAATARAAGRPMPVLVMHDVAWPYARRDLYYAPETIPAEHRQPYALRGIVPGRRALTRKGGINADVHNALEEGGPRNGVLTALEDFLDEHDEPARTVILPVYFGLAVVAERSRLEREPELAAVLDRLEGAEGQRELAILADELRVKALVRQHTRAAVARRTGREGADRYLNLLATALLDEHYPENELRVQYLWSCARRGHEPDTVVVRRPDLRMAADLERLEAQRSSGSLEGDGLSRHPYFPYTTMGRTRLDHLSASLDAIAEEGVAGDVVECGTGRGGGAIFLRGHLEARGDTARTVWVADAFVADAEPAPRRFQPPTADLNEVRRGFARFGLLDDRVRFLQGRVPDALQDAAVTTIALLRVGHARGVAPGDVLEALYDRVADGGVVVVEHAGDPDALAEVEAFRARRGVEDPLERIDAGAVTWRKRVPAATPAPAEAPRTRDLRRAPLAPPATRDALDLSVVVVFHDMRREAERTLHSLSRPYQENVDGLGYEVIAVENGSAPEQRLGEDLVRGFGQEFRYLDLGEDAHPSPVRALNRGIAASRGRAVALMIDGAHVLSPGVLHHGMVGLAAYPPAIVAAQRWFVGPGRQPLAVAAGYDRDYEDRLFDAIGWPSRGYDLFTISHFSQDRDWFDGISESSCLFAPRDLLEQSGGFDESFDVAGGELSNPDVFERLGAAPGVTVVTILGEGAFHQIHGGTVSNVGDQVELRSRVESYRERYEAMRGRRLRAPAKPTHYVGRLDRRTLRTKPRWRASPNLMKAGLEPPPGDAVPDEPALMPTELAEQYLDAWWHSLAWQDAEWLGQPIRRPPGDLVAYQELVARLRPDRILVAGDEDAALSGFLRSICRLAGHGEVTDVGGDPGKQAGDAAEPDALVFLAGPATRDETLGRFEALAPLVPVGGYVVVENTIVGGHPVRPAFGPGPMEAVIRILARDRRGWVDDRTLERYGPTFNPRGFLRRVAR